MTSVWFKYFGWFLAWLTSFNKKEDKFLCFPQRAAGASLAYGLGQHKFRHFILLLLTFQLSVRSSKNQKYIFQKRPSGLVELWAIGLCSSNSILMCSLWSKCSGLHKSSQNAFVKPNKDWCWLQWLWSGRWSVNYYSWSRLGPAWQRSTSIARLGVKYVSICPLVPAAAAHFMPLNNSPSNNHRPLQWQWRGPALWECLDTVHGQPSKLQHFCNSPILLLTAIHQSVLGGVLRCQHQGAQGGAGDHRPRPGPPTSRGADTSY